MSRALTPPPLPPPAAPRRPLGFTLKCQQADSRIVDCGPLNKPSSDCCSPPAGTYFFYGTLRHPRMLMEILGLEELPTLRPAKVYGYGQKLWGQYPALVDGSHGSVVLGEAFHVPSASHAQKLADYETSNYKAGPCYIEYADGSEPGFADGHIFLFCGNAKDLSEGEFDLDRWLRQMKWKA